MKRSARRRVAGFSNAHVAALTTLLACAPLRGKDEAPVIVRGVLRPGAPYGLPTEVLPGMPVGLAIADSGASCRALSQLSRTDSLGRFEFTLTAASMSAGWLLCVAGGPTEPPRIPTFRGERPARPVLLECLFHGDHGSPQCEARKSLDAAT